jgi:hypothetical protein
MTKGQANELLSQDLSRENGSAYLRQLNKGFDGLSILQNARIYWAYETRESRTVVGSLHQVSITNLSLIRPLPC